MDSINKITELHINRLEPDQLVELMHMLLSIEANYNGIEACTIVPYNLTTPDAGIDGSINWTGQKDHTEYLPTRYNGFQSKKASLNIRDCEKEILKPKEKKKPRVLKDQIKVVADNNGSYILFTGASHVKSGIDKRKDKFSKAFVASGHPNASTVTIDVYDANRIRDWVNKHISAVTLVQTFLGIHRPQSFLTWDSWDSKSRSNEIKYRTNDILLGYVEQIQKTIQSQNVIRVYGHSGLGKSRLVLEAFRNNNLRSSLVYYDLAGFSSIAEIKTYILSSQGTQEGIIIIDNCTYKDHNILADIVKTGSIKIITIGPNDSDFVQDSKIKLDRKDQLGIVREIIDDKLGQTHSQTERDYLSEICEGYPWMAKRFCEAILKGDVVNLNTIPPGELIEKLLFGKKDTKKYKVIRACAVFSSFGFPDDEIIELLSKDNRDFLDKQLNYINNTVLNIGISESEFYEIVKEHKKDDLIERHGLYYIVKPTVLAINLAADWLLSTPHSIILKILTDLKGEELGKKIVERIKDLDQSGKAHTIVAELWGPDGFFATAEVLNTSWGSLLFRYVVEVNPIATAKTLEKVFGGMSKEELLKISEGRRNLVWALEKLCFRQETFNTATKILYSFAVSENERLGNNATGQFIQLFQLYLAGTQANLPERLEIINWGLSKGNEDYTRLAILALGRAIYNHDYRRMVGAENQGSSAPLKEYVPKGNEPIVYWTSGLEILTQIACSNDIHSNLAKEQITHSIRTLLRDGQYEILFSAIHKIIKATGAFWPDALNTLKMSVHFEKHLQENIVKEVNALVEILTPTDIKSRLMFSVTKPEWSSYEKDEHGQYVDKTKINIVTFAKELITEKIPWIEHIKDLLQGEQRQAFNFGVVVGQNSQSVEEIISEAIVKLREIPKEQQNPELIGGLLAGSNDRLLKEKILDSIIKDEKLKFQAFYLTRVIEPSLKDIEKLFSLIDKGEISITYFRNFQYGQPLDKLSKKEVIDLCTRIETYGNPGKWTALSLLYMNGNFDPSKAKQYVPSMKKIISSGNMLKGLEKVGSMDVFHWSDTVKKILSNKNESEFAILITKQIVEICSEQNYFYRIDTDIEQLLPTLFDNYFEVIWEYIGEGLIGDYLTFFHLSHLIGTRNGWLGGRDGIAFRDETRWNFIFEWCRRHVPIAPVRIAHMMPLTAKIGEIETWHPFSKKILDEFGNVEHLLDQLSSNMGTFGTIGTSVPYYETQKMLLEELLTHKFEEVRNWAKNMLSYATRMVKTERIKDEQRYL